MNLYRVTVETEFFIVAEDEDDAYQVSRNVYGEALEAEYPDLMFTSEVDDINTVSNDWRNSLPWGKNPDDLTCAQWLALGKLAVHSTTGESK